MNLYSGVFTAVVTPLTPSGSLDLESFDKLLDLQLAAKVNGIVPCGTTGESPTLTDAEKRILIQRTVSYTNKKALVIAGTGSNNTQKTIEETLVATDLGADAALIVTPYYNKPSQAGLEAHYFKIAEETKIPIILYNVPGRTGVSLSTQTIAQLATHPRIVGLKEASGNLSFLSEIKQAVSKNTKPFSLLSGDDPSFWPFLLGGGNGIISVASNILPKLMCYLYECAINQKIDAGLALHNHLLHFLQTLFIESNPVPIKTILSLVNGRLINPAVRLPLVSLQPESLKKLTQAWKALSPQLREDLYA